MRICRFVSAVPATTGSIGRPARAYSPARLSDSAQKWGGVHKKMIRNRMSGSTPMRPVAATQPITGGKPAAAGNGQRGGAGHPCDFRGAVPHFGQGGAAGARRNAEKGDEADEW